ncbi:bifunctional phosphoribosyl-AMP cyclohydrolase/phosphoribosyl-ATP diphosphatase HisIE [Deferribacterales bacterium RsTz2092]|nr:histidine biosynthesis bifunctional protein HisIE [Deferribacterales bacterium]
MTKMVDIDTNKLDFSKLDFDKLGGLIPACVQDYKSMRLLMVGFMNRDALEKTLATGLVCFWSRDRKCLWTKGETSGNTLSVKDMVVDCDNDTLLIFAKAAGPTCHTGAESCFDSDELPAVYWLSKLEKIIEGRHKDAPEGSYTVKLFEDGVKRIAQKVGEEGVETALAATCGDNEELANEAADLLFHLLVLLRSKNMELSAVTDVLKDRMK